MTGKLPDSLSSIESLEVLDLSGNNLQGPVPAKFAATYQLGHSESQQHKLTGALPHQVAILGAKLSHCNLSTMPEFAYLIVLNM